MEENKKGSQIITSQGSVISQDNLQTISNPESYEIDLDKIETVEQLKRLTIALVAGANIPHINIHEGSPYFEYFKPCAK